METGTHCLFTLEFYLEERKKEGGGGGKTGGVRVVCGRPTISRLTLAVSSWTFAGFGRLYGFAKSFFGEGRTLSGES